ncbi:hypothetical protein KIH39_11865 [Telmatocola sphagniphila]|uniref:Uncharacterized protein n=1 Tax=Telmatocola sphagniphila TaxID=1123043 RepID=A0A8E6F096_9BACT|nr:hypothetical protein [Telmatocola sphagniphila]QVL34568.1 hypothetical protein KIH39_11865 [Telmatocola sphagniphila]
MSRTATMSRMKRIRNNAASRSSRVEALNSAPPTKLEILGRLNAEFLRACQEIYAFAVFAERFAAHPVHAVELSERGQQAILHAFQLGDTILNLQGQIQNEIDEDHAVEEAYQVAQKSWENETCEKLRERASELILFGEVRLAIRLIRLCSARRSLSSLYSLLENAEPGLTSTLVQKSLQLGSNGH